MQKTMPKVHASLEYAQNSRFTQIEFSVFILCSYLFFAKDVMRRKNLCFFVNLKKYLSLLKNTI